jgi:hypothetical protein
LTLIAFPGLDLSDRFALTGLRPPSSPTHQRKLPADQAGIASLAHFDAVGRGHPPHQNLIGMLTPLGTAAPKISAANQPE